MELDIIWYRATMCFDDYQVTIISSFSGVLFVHNRMTKHNTIVYETENTAFIIISVFITMGTDSQWV